MSMKPEGPLDEVELGVRKELLTEAQSYRDRLVAYAQRILGDREEAEDVAQEVLLKTRRIEQRPTRLGGWLHAVCYRQAVDRRRTRERRARLLQAMPSREQQQDTTTVAERKDELRQLRRCLETLEEPFRTALTLRYLEGLPFPEVAERMGTPERTARSRVARGLAKLRQRLGGRK